MSWLAMQGGATDAKWIQLFTAVLRARKVIPDADIAAAVYEALPITTLAVLLDDSVAVDVENGRVVLSGDMQYRYATSLLRVRNGSLEMSETTRAGTNRVETITELTELANESLPVLIAEHDSLRRVTEYSRILAFLRWARQPGNILAIDFAELGSLAASDREKTPTADALLPSRR